jgi:hypothetical protein
MHQLRIQGKNNEAIFDDELQQVFDHLPIDHTKLMLGEYNVVLGREDL